MPRIMIVDDDRIGLKSLYRIVRKLKGCEVETFLSVYDAMEDAKNKDYALIISDYRMPEMDGIAFLRQIKRIQPRAARMILSGQCDKQSLYGAINEANALRYIEKPCDPAALQRIISEVLSDRQSENSPTVQELLGIIRDMEMVIRDQEKQICDMKAQVIEGDPVVSAVPTV